MGKMSKNKKKQRIMLSIIAALVVAIGIGVGILVMSNHSNDQEIVVMLDAYGDSQTGKTGLIRESEFNEALVTAVQKELKGSGATVVLSHEAGSDASTEMRLQKAQEEKADLLVSFRCTASGEGNTDWAIYACPPSLKTNSDSLVLANAIQAAYANASLTVPVEYYTYHEIRTSVYEERIVSAEDTTDYGEETFTLMQESGIPAVTITTIDVNDETAVNTYNTEEEIEKLAEIYASGIKDAIGTLYE